MLPIIRKSLPLVLSHLVTFTFLAVGPLAGKPHAVTVMSLLLPLWMTSTVLWIEVGESNPFLRILPITQRDIARIKFTLAFCFLCACGLVQLTATALSGVLLDDPGVTITMIAGSSSIALVLGAVAYLAIWFVGVKPLIPVYVLFHAGTAVAIVLFLERYMPRLDRSPIVRLAADIPWPVALVVFAIVIAGYFALVDVAARIRQLDRHAA